MKIRTRFLIANLRWPSFILASLLILSFFLINKRRNARYIESVKIDEIRFSQQVSLSEVCAAVNKNSIGSEKLFLTPSPMLSNKTISSFYHSTSNANVVIWNIASAFDCDVKIEGKGIVYLCEK